MPTEPEWGVAEAASHCGDGEAGRILAASTSGIPWGPRDAEMAAWLAGYAPDIAVTVASWLIRAKTLREEDRC